MQSYTLEEPAYPQSYFRIPAKIISYVFHPLFIPTFIFFWLVIRFPFQFEGITPQLLFFREFNVFWMTAFFPAFSVFLLWRLKLIDNILLKTQRERIVPYIITMVFYWWMWYLSRSSAFSDQPQALRYFYFGIFLTTVFGLIINSFVKISMHAMAIGGAFAFVILVCVLNQTLLGSDVCAITLFAGLVCTARLLLNTHSNGEVYSGLFVGVVCQLLAAWVL